MKNIQYYNAPKYATDLYQQTASQIYKTCESSPSNGCLSLQGVMDEQFIKTLLSLEGWTKGTGAEEDLLILDNKEIRYYRDLEEEEEEEEFFVYTNMNTKKELSYVTSLKFEQEVEYEENEPSSPYISQYPLEDLLEKFNCEVLDFYEELNKEDLVYSYIKVFSPKKKNIQNLLSIIGKHVYNKAEG
ncbi:MAG: hypothetical protein KBT48_10180, partial [Firmicutes bacterium]|nr:hypothetical protein [Bacillota bacterium]